MKTPIIIGNWKMNETVSETIRLLTELKGLISGKQEVEVVVAPPFCSLYSAEIAAQGTTIKIAAQNMHFEESGAYTGEVSPPMLIDVGCKYVILGHSERRQYFKEDDVLINKKVKAALENQLSAVLCIGETKEDRQTEKTFEVIETQLREGLRGINDSDAENLVVAYEPVWAIGTGETATPDIAEEVHAFIAEKLETIFRKDVAQTIRITYGGSVKPDNIKDLMAQAHIDGALVGGASLNAETFAKIVSYKD